MVQSKFCKIYNSASIIISSINNMIKKIQDQN